MVIGHPGATGVYVHHTLEKNASHVDEGDRG